MNLVADGKILNYAKSKAVDIKKYKIIYHLTEGLAEMQESFGLDEEQCEYTIAGNAVVKAIFKAKNGTNAAGLIVTDGKFRSGMKF